MQDLANKIEDEPKSSHSGSSDSARPKSMANRAKAEQMGEITSQKAFSEINLDEDALENMSPRLRDEIQVEI